MRLVSKCLWWYTQSIRTALARLDRTVSERAEDRARGQGARIDDLNKRIDLLAAEVRALRAGQDAAAKEADRVREDLLNVSDEAAEWRSKLKQLRK
jgi:hypothetical protein